MKVYRELLPLMPMDIEARQRLEHIKRMSPEMLMSQTRAEIPMLERHLELRRRETIFVQPGRDQPGVDAWHKSVPTSVGSPAMGMDARVPSLMTLVFIDGVCEVDDALGAYLIEKAIALKKPPKKLKAVA